MRNKVEILRSIQYTKDDVVNFPSLSAIADYDELDFEFMEEFKKVYEMGLNQLESFIKKLDEEGEDLDVYSIQYYTKALLHGPLSNFAKELGKDKNYFLPTPDIMGVSGNKYRASANTTILPTTPLALGANVDIYNKLPAFMQKSVTAAVKECENVFQNSAFGTTFMDNTLPIVDKSPSDRYDKEPTGELNTLPHGNLGVKDSFFFEVMSEINQSIFEKVEEYLNSENFRLFKDNKEYAPFDSEDNTSTSENYKIERIITPDNIVILDLLGTPMDSIERREAVLKIETDEAVVEYDLHSNVGQLDV